MLVGWATNITKPTNTPEPTRTCLLRTFTCCADITNLYVAVIGTLLVQTSEASKLMTLCF
jgi:hypothetical protein